LVRLTYGIIIAADFPQEATMTLSASEWAAQQWAQADLGDRRRTQRAVEMGAKIAAHPDASLPNQMESRAALRGAYRILNHPEVTLEALLAPHCQATLTAAGQVPLVLMAEDTTELDYTAHPHTTGLGPIGDGRGRGLLLHSTLAIVPDSRSVLGLACGQVILREPTPKSRPHWTRSAEGRVWQVSARAIGPPPAGSVWVHVSDRGSDIFEYMAECRQQNKPFVVRAFHNRVLMWAADAPEATPAEAHALLDYARSLAAQPNSTYTVHMPATKDHPARDAQVGLAWAPVTFSPPTQAPPEVRQLAPLNVWLVRAWEPNPPDGVEPVEWILLTSLPVCTLTDAQRTTSWYECRWLCEDFHQCLKTGCRVEDSQLDDGADLQRLLGFAVPIAVRLLQLRQAARNIPDVPATAIVEPLMVQVLARRQKADAETMTAAEFWRRLARLGGHQGRRRDGSPGWRTVWRGWRLLSDLTEGARLFVAPDTG
jgi:hypothetical protein